MAGVLTVLFEYAKDLDNVKYPLPQNPFCIISIGDEEEETRPHEGSKTTPVWFETRTLNVKNEMKFSVEVHHYSDGDGESKFIGSGEGDMTRVRAQGWDREQQVAIYSILGHRYGFVQVTLQFSEKDPWELLSTCKLNLRSQRALAASTLKAITWEQFSKVGEGEREVWKEAFSGMDSDGNGTLSVQELDCVLTPIFSNHNIKHSPQSIIDLFHFLDTDDNGQLDSKEMVAIRAIFNSSICDCCSKYIFSDNLWACRTCCTEHQLTPDIEKDGSKWVTFCAECQATQPDKTCCPFSTSHCLEVVPNGSLLGLSTQDWGWSQQLTTKECSCCGESHQRMPGYLSQGSAPQHMLSDGKGGYVCEWCCVWMCKCCSELKCDLATPIRGCWSAKTYKCGGSGCSKKGDGGWHIKPEALVKFGEDSGIKHCKTCLPRLLDPENSMFLHSSCPGSSQQQQPQQRRQQQQQQQQQQQATPRSEDVVTSQVTTPSEEDECVICQGAKPNAGFLHGDSMHKCVCTDCSKLIQVGAPCPLCRVPVERIIAVF